MKDYKDLKVSRIEKIIVNWAALPDSIFYSIKSILTKDKYSGQTIKERFNSAKESRLKRYKKLLKLRKEYGKLDHVKLLAKSPCDYTRIYLSKLR
jgi:hypothetical protein